MWMSVKKKCVIANVSAKVSGKSHEIMMKKLLLLINSKKKLN